MYNILEHKSSCTKADPRSIQLCSTFSSSLIWHWFEELLVFIFCELAMSWLPLLHHTGSEDTVSSWFLFTASMPLMILQITVISFFIHVFFLRGRLIGYCLLRLGRYQPNKHYSICRHIMDLHDRLMFVFQLCSVLSILLPFSSYFWYFAVLAVIEDRNGINLNYLLQPSWSTEFELRAYNFIYTHIHHLFHLPYFILLHIYLHQILSLSYCLGTDVIWHLFASLLYIFIFIYMDNLGRFFSSLYMPFQNHILTIVFISWISSCRCLWNTSGQSLYYGKITIYCKLLSSASLTNYLSMQEILFLPCGFLVILRLTLDLVKCLVKIQASNGPLLSTWLLAPSRNSSRLVRQDF